MFAGSYEAMGVRLASFLLLAAIVSARGAAVTSARSLAGTCHVTGSTRLPARLDAQEICSVIAQSMAEHAPAASYQVEVQVRSKSRLTASLIVNGHVLPIESMAVSDSEIGPGSLKRFADRLSAVAAATK